MRPDTQPGTGAVGVVVDQFPSISETFILREMLELERAGFQLVPLARAGLAEGEPHADAASLAARTVYRSVPGSPRSLANQIRALLRYPAGYLSALTFALRHSIQTPAYARELLGALLAAGDFAVGIPRGTRLAHVHAQFCSVPATIGLLLAEILGVSFSMSGHARDVFTHESILLGHKLVEAEFTTVCTRHARDRLLRQYPLATGERLHLIYHGIDPSRFVPSRSPRPLPREILSVGRLVPKKGFDILLRAAAIVRSRGAEFVLRIVGDGPERDDLERLAVGLGLREVAVFHGRLTQEELLPLYERAHAFALASIVTEDGDRDGLPNVLLEALAMGVPTVATTTGGIPELIVHEETGLLAQPGDPESLALQLERILYDEELRDRVVRAGRERVVLDFDSRRNIEKLVGLLGRYVQREGPAGSPPAEQ